MNSPKEIANNYIAIGKGKVNTPVAKMFVLGILARNLYRIWRRCFYCSRCIYSAGICRQVSRSMHLPGRIDYGTPRWK